jgi:hypothetical protein
LPNFGEIENRDARLFANVRIEDRDVSRARLLTVPHPMLLRGPQRNPSKFFYGFAARGAATGAASADAKKQNMV